jgi:hypothetical protein
LRKFIHNYDANQGSGSWIINQFVRPRANWDFLNDQSLAMIIGVCDAPLLLSISLRKLQVRRKASVAAKTINVLYTIKKFKALFRRTQSNFHAPPEASTETVSARFHAPETLFKAFHK